MGGRSADRRANTGARPERAMDETELLAGVSAGGTPVSTFFSGRATPRGSLYGATDVPDPGERSPSTHGGGRRGETPKEGLGTCVR